MTMGRNNILFAVLLILAACTSQPHDVQRVHEQPAIYPDYVGVTVPIGIAPLNFSMADDAYTTIDVTIKSPSNGHSSLTANGTFADFDINEWHQLLEENKGGSLTVTVCAEKDGQWLQFDDFTINVSPYAMEEWGITYRRIPPSYEMYSHMGIYQRDLSNFDESPILENTRIPNQCINCHYANRTNPDQYVFHIRGEHGATFLSLSEGAEGGQLLQARNDSLGGSMVYPYWHPGGRYCAFSTNKTSQMFHTHNKQRIEVYDSSSDVFIYDTQTHTVLKDTLTMKLLWAENCPAFSPDGRWLYYVTARRQVYPTDYDKERYSLCRVPFDPETGRLGLSPGPSDLAPQVDTLVSADAIGKSVTWPRPSYDGRYVMFTEVDYGYFSVWHPEADLWLLDLQTGESRPLSEVNSPRAESLHQWNVNSHWFLFTSRRDDGLYTRVYFASIDDQGRVSKPFMLPQRNPKEYYRDLLYSYNTPDFTSRPVKLDARALGRSIESDERVGTIVK